MSRGYGVIANLAVEDEGIVIYEYGAINLNIPESSNKDSEKDGLLTFPKAILIEPEIRIKRRKKPTGGQRFIEKKIIREFYEPVIEAIGIGDISIENSKYEWEFVPIGEALVGRMALRALWGIFEEYQENDGLSEKVILIS
ncbi:hypothetical protein BAU15_01660 [Enterococcus sp. JM4C]|uniref:hypothetical protein n=1 Tax=Candidatus Enterococcus huntleyi TaxID=1857217 RepID=UPI00137A2F42|nr:hypothetical protein [Enterococcus sp. JM4C]KAF1299379.1 hypothetical protein BAU15_01660 [Enterococcus sp. JM4C]